MLLINGVKLFFVHETHFQINKDTLDLIGAKDRGLELRCNNHTVQNYMIVDGSMKPATFDVMVTDLFDKLLKKEPSIKAFYLNPVIQETKLHNGVANHIKLAYY